MGVSEIEVVGLVFSRPQCTKKIRLCSHIVLKINIRLQISQGDELNIMNLILKLEFFYFVKRNNIKKN